MRPKRLISLLVAVCMMITMLPLSAVTAFAADTASSTVRTAIVDGYKYEYKVMQPSQNFLALMIQQTLLIQQALSPTTSKYPKSWVSTL